MKPVPFQRRIFSENFVNSIQGLGGDADQFAVTFEDHLDYQKAINKVIDSLTAEGVIVLDPLPLLS